MAKSAPTPLGSELLVTKSSPLAASAPAASSDEPVRTATPGTLPILAPAPPVLVAEPELAPAWRSVLEPKIKPVRVPLTVKIRPETLRRLRLVAVHHEVEQQDIVEEALTQWLDFNGPK